MEYLLNAERDSISNALLMNNNLVSTDPSASPFGFHNGGSSQLLDRSLQFPQKKLAGNERSHEETQGFMISSNGAQEFRSEHVPASMSTDFMFAEATPMTTTELRPCHSAALATSARLSVNSGGTVKVGKKRSRASRRAPTTLLNTDPSNFRAMVQRFTGIPETPFGYSSMNPTFSPQVVQQNWQLLGEPLPYKAVPDLNMSCVSHINSARDSYYPQQDNGTTFIPLQAFHDYINNSTGPKYTQGLDDLGLINSGSVFPTPAITSSSDRRPAYFM